MDVSTMLEALSDDSAGLPREAMLWAQGHWTEAGPALLARLAAYADGLDRTEDNATVVFFGLHLMAEQREAAGFAPLCRLLREPEDADAALGDAATDTLPAILVACFDGDPAPLKAVIEDEAVDDPTRAGALDAMAELAGVGQIRRTEMEAYLRQLVASLDKLTDDIIWMAWVDAVIKLRLAGLAEMAEQLFADGSITEDFMRLEDFRNDYASGTSLAMVEPIEDAVARLETWHCFSEDGLAERRADMAADEDDDAPWEPPLMPVVNPLRGLGRNDPCHCGSGKKYKKCCLV